MRKHLIIGLLAVMLFLMSAASALAEGGQVHYVRPGESLTSIALYYGVTPQAIMNANGLQNPDYIYAGQKLIIPGHGYSGSGQGGTYTVRQGDTLNSIALKFNTTPQALATANNLSDADVIYAGQTLNVPGGAAQSPGYSGNTGMCGQYYSVRWGDTLSAIAARHGTTVNALMQANNLARETINEGQRLCLPGGAAPPAMSPQQGQQQFYVVKRGDTVAGIAARFGVTQAAIIRANNLSQAATIYPGQKLVIPGKGPAHMPDNTMKPTGPKPPDYVPRDDPANGEACENPIDVWTHKDQAKVEAVNAWCPKFDVVDDPDGLTSILIRVAGREDAAVKIQRGNDGPITVYTSSSPGFGADAVWYPTSPGYYQVWVDSEEEPSGVATFDLSPGRRGWVDFSLVSVSQNPRPRASSGWSGRVSANNSQTTPQNGVSSVIIVRGPAQGLPIQINAEGPFTARCYTGQKPEYGPGACEFGGLWPGKYTVTLEGAGAAVAVYVDGVGTAEITFDRQ